jgi:hypothetical protein
VTPVWVLAELFLGAGFRCIFHRDMRESEAGVEKWIDAARSSRISLTAPVFRRILAKDQRVEALETTVLDIWCLVLKREEEKTASTPSQAIEPDIGHARS